MNKTLNDILNFCKESRENAYAEYNKENKSPFYQGKIEVYCEIIDLIYGKNDN